MFNCEAAFHQHRKKHGHKEAIEYIADVNRHTALQLPSEEGGGKSTSPSLGWMRSLFDRNEHFIEISNMGEEDRSLELLLTILFLSLPVSMAILFGMSLFYSNRITTHFLWAAFFLQLSDFVVYFGLYQSPQHFSPISAPVIASTTPHARYTSCAQSDMAETSSLIGTASRHT
ncbi:hypothetical protein [Ralstonia solanacearum]|uniref:hypothetical protein n=1 Tax=Ralstonia solanacearum TaxID=305 RepID=UPI001E4946D7|nr:hypothetical protein [Ralstonia solanacearum]